MFLALPASIRNFCYLRVIIILYQNLHHDDKVENEIKSFGVVYYLFVRFAINKVRNKPK